MQTADDGTRTPHSRDFAESQAGCVVGVCVCVCVYASRCSCARCVMRVKGLTSQSCSVLNRSVNFDKEYHCFNVFVVVASELLLSRYFEVKFFNFIWCMNVIICHESLTIILGVIVG